MKHSCKLTWALKLTKQVFSHRTFRNIFPEFPICTAARWHAFWAPFFPPFCPGHQSTGPTPLKEQVCKDRMQAPMGSTQMTLPPQHNCLALSLRHIYSFFFFLNRFFFNFWLRWVFVAARGPSLVAVTGAYSLRWLLLLRAWALDTRASVVTVHGT